MDIEKLVKRMVGKPKVIFYTEGKYHEWKPFAESSAIIISESTPDHFPYRNPTTCPQSNSTVANHLASRIGCNTDDLVALLSEMYTDKKNWRTINRFLMCEVKHYKIIDYNKIFIVISAKDIITQAKAEIKLEENDLYLLVWKFPNIIDSGSKYILKSKEEIRCNLGQLQWIKRENYDIEDIWIHPNVLEIVELNSEGQFNPTLLSIESGATLKNEPKRQWRIINGYNLNNGKVAIYNQISKHIQIHNIGFFVNNNAPISSIVLSSTANIQYVLWSENRWFVAQDDYCLILNNNGVKLSQIPGYSNISNSYIIVLDKKIVTVVYPDGSIKKRSLENDDSKYVQSVNMIDTNILLVFYQNFPPVVYVMDSPSTPAIVAPHKLTINSDYQHVVSRKNIYTNYARMICSNVGPLLESHLLPPLIEQIVEYI